MSGSALDAALAADSLIITPGERLAREIVVEFDAAHRRRGAAAWPAARVLSWNAWLDRLWHTALAKGALGSPAILLTDETASEIWRRVVDGSRPALMNLLGTVRELARAWRLFHAWRDSTSEALPDPQGATENGEAFRAWALAYRDQLAALSAIDRAMLPDQLARFASPQWLGGLPHVLLYGFDVLTAQQQRLVAAMASSGVEIARSGIYDDPDDDTGAHSPHHRERRRFATPRAELVEALVAARQILEADRGARLAIVLADLEARRDAVEALAEEILCPEHLEHFEPDAPRPYTIALGRTLAEAPMIAAALDLIGLAGTVKMNSMRMARVLRTRFLPGASDRAIARGAAEFRWRSMRRRDVDFAEVMASLRELDPELAQRWDSAPRPPARAAMPRDWARGWAAWLDALGWPGDVPLSSAEWQARDAWGALLARFAAIGPATGVLHGEAALARLVELAGDRLFQPQAPIPPVRILGVEDAHGLEFDFAWLAGFDDEQWPPVARPTPWLPIGWQRARGIPQATPEGALAVARRRTADFGRIARRVVVSYAESADGAARSVSPLFAGWPERSSIEAGGSSGVTAETRVSAMQRSGTIDELEDSVAPSIERGTHLNGGANRIDSHSACPFQAFARYRLAVSRPPELADGIPASERGKLMHAALAAFWGRIGGHAQLAALDEEALRASVGVAAAAGIAQLDPALRASLPQLVIDGERSRIAVTMMAWLAGYELPRPSFGVVACERSVKATIEDVGFGFRIDRIDRLKNGEVAIIDYKTGRASGPARWFGPRPEGIQLAAYALALNGSHAADSIRGTLPAGAAVTADPGRPMEVGALAYAQLKAGALGVHGMTRDASSWPGLADAGRVSGAGASWTAALAELGERVEDLVRELRDGRATVSPRDPGVCRHCDLKPLCRIRAFHDDQDDDREQDDDGA